MPKKIGSGKGLAFVNAALESETDECIVWPYYRMKNGYGHLGTHTGMVLAHRYVCEKAYGPAPEDKPQAAHWKCGNRGCVNKRHLHWSSAKENEDDKKEHGTWLSRITAARVTEELVRTMRVERMMGMTNKQISQKHGVPKSTVLKIVLRHTWKHVVP